jgi:hypothetical protein
MPSIEHIFPAALGPHADVTLPEGAVCRRCNNWLGQQVDEALVHLVEVQLIRGRFRIPDRNGRTTDTIPLANGTLSFGPDGAIRIEQITSKPPQVERGDLTLLLQTTRRRSGDQWRRVARAVMKLGLNLLYSEQGAATALDPRFDGARRAILGEAYEGFLLIGAFDIFRRPDLVGSVRTDGPPGVPEAAELRFGGLHLIAPLLLGAPHLQTQKWAEQEEFALMRISDHPNFRAKELS